MTQTSEEAPTDPQATVAEATHTWEISDEDLARILSDHQQWIESGHQGGHKADLTNANLPKAAFAESNLRDATLFNANFEGAFLKAATLQAADLSHANLQNADLQGAILRGANLYGANLQRANLQDADLLDVTGLRADRLAGTNLSNAKLPEDIARFEGVEHVENISKHARNNFLAMVGGCVFSWLTILQTTDVALLTGATATPLPIIQTPVPIVGFYWAAPAILLTLYLYLHLYLQRMWEGLASLPAIFPSGRTLDQRAYPWLLSGLVSAYVPRLRLHRPALWRLQVGLSILGAWVLVPLTLLFFWGRYLPRHDWPGTLWLSGLLIIAVALALTSYRLAAKTLRGDYEFDPLMQATDPQPLWRRAARFVQDFHSERWVLASAGLTLLLSVGAIEGSPRGSGDSLRNWIPSPYNLVGYRTFADLTDIAVSTRPADWWRATEAQQLELAGIRGADLRGRDLRYAEASDAFLAKADLRGADLKNAQLVRADLQAATLMDSNLQRANLRRANLQEANLFEANLQEATLTSANLQNANLVIANLDGANLASAKLWRASLGNATLRGALLHGADLSGAKGLTQKQLNLACGDEHTLLPTGLAIKICSD